MTTTDARPRWEWHSETRKPERDEVVLARRIGGASPMGTSGPVRGGIEVHWSHHANRPQSRWQVRYVDGGSPKRRHWSEASGDSLLSVLRHVCRKLGISPDVADDELDRSQVGLWIGQVWS